MGENIKCKSFTIKDRMSENGFASETTIPNFSMISVL
jgi:hypothetical protein